MSSHPDRVFLLPDASRDTLQTEVYKATVQAEFLASAMDDRLFLDKGSACLDGLSVCLRDLAARLDVVSAGLDSMNLKEASHV